MVDATNSQEMSYNPVGGVVPANYKKLQREDLGFKSVFLGEHLVWIFFCHVDGLGCCSSFPGPTQYMLVILPSSLITDTRNSGGPHLSRHLPKFP